MFEEEWVVAYGIPERLLTNDGTQYFGKFYNANCNALDTKLVTKIVYCLQTSG